MEVFLAILIVISFVVSVALIVMTIVKALYDKGMSIKRLGILLAISFAVFVLSIVYFDKTVKQNEVQKEGAVYIHGGEDSSISFQIDE
ncbi:hypothetical protein [Lederbergia graminis]|uniref:NADH dehydrogenase subunit 6 n=1 Tax=Lederbergia graminis TaxID=735518 RepID=A0ABW0LHT2_9BACI